MDFNKPGIWLKELIKLPVFEHAQVLSGKSGLGNLVRYVDILEVPEIKGWAREGELLLTTGYAFKDTPEKLFDLLQELIRVQAAALIIKTDRFIGVIPEEVLQFSDDNNFPIIQLPSEIPYIDVTHDIMEQILQKQAALLRKSEQTYRTLTKLVINNEGIESVVAHVSKLLQAPIWLMDVNKNFLAGTEPQSQLPDTAKVWKITADQRHMGYLYLKKSIIDEVDLAVIEQAKLAFSLEFLQLKVRQDTERRLQGDFLQELLLGLPIREADIVERSRQFELEPDWEYRTVLFSCKANGSTTRDAFTSNLEIFQRKMTSSNVGKTFIIGHGHFIVMVLSAPNLTGIIPHWLDEMSTFLHKWPDYQAGYGRSKSLAGLAESYMQAKMAAEIGSAIHPDKQVFGYHQYEYIHLISQSYETGWKSMVEERIGPLIKHDQEKGTAFVQTLFHYLDTNGSLMETAARMYIHRNSVKYRIDRMKEMLLIPFEQELDKMGYYVAIAIYLLREKP